MPADATGKARWTHPLAYRVGTFERSAEGDARLADEIEAALAERNATIARLKVRIDAIQSCHKRHPDLAFSPCAACLDFTERTK